MSDSDRPKPLPARPPSPPPASEGPADPAAAAPAAPLGSAAAPADAPEEVELTAEGRTWVARVIGRAGRAEARSAPLLLVSFRESGPAGEEAALESLVPGRRLRDVPEEELRAALGRAKPPAVPGQRRPFFDDSEPTRRSGPIGEY